MISYVSHLKYSTADMRARFRRITIAGCALLATLSIAGCETQPDRSYYWGNYEALIYERFEEPNGVELNKHISALERILVRAREINRPVAPGIHAHLGYLYSLRGDLDLARQSLLLEKRFYPEAGTYVDRMLDGLIKMSGGNGGR